MNLALPSGSSPPENPPGKATIWLPLMALTISATDCSMASGFRLRMSTCLLYTSPVEEYKARIQRLGQLKGGRVIAISDIHGHAQWLKRLLEELRWTDQDELFIVGDLIERGPENLETLRLIMELQRRGAHVSRGNWDLHVLKLLDGAKDQADNGLMSAARAFTQRFGNSLLGDFLQGAGMDLGMEGEENRVLRAIQAAYAPEIEFLRGLPDIMETPHMIFVHGGIPHERLDVLEDQSAGVF